MKKSLDRVKAISLKGKPHKGNPPYPPLTGGYKKAMRPYRVEGLCFCPFAGGLFSSPGSRGFAFSCPPVKGG